MSKEDGGAAFVCTNMVGHGDRCSMNPKDGYCCRECSHRSITADLVLAVTEFRDAWREDHSHIPPLEQTRDFGPHLRRIWNALSTYELAMLEARKR